MRGGSQRMDKQIPNYVNILLEQVSKPGGGGLHKVYNFHHVHHVNNVYMFIFIIYKMFKKFIMAIVVIMFIFL